MPKLILDLCGGTGAWSKPYRDHSDYMVIVVDPFVHPEGDVRLLSRISEPVYGILAAPPCTVFANSGARWPRTKEQILEGLSVVDACLRQVVLALPTFWALENPKGKLKKYLGEPRYRFHPYYFGDPYSKHTCLWGNFNIPRENRVPIDPKLKEYIHNMPDSKQRARLRSITPPGFAQAFFEANR